jgi:putative DNA primase/helicase
VTEYQKNQQNFTGERLDELLRKLRNVPDDLTRRPQWVVWRYETRDERETKVPYIPGGVGRASTTDLMTWRTFEEATDALQQGSGRWSGVGFVFCSGDPFVGVDLDECRDPETGDLQPWAEIIVEDMREGAYIEVSPSGRGVHLICIGKFRGKRRGSVEVYSQERYFTVTGEVL